MKLNVIFFLLFFFIGLCYAQQDAAVLPRSNYDVFSGLLNRCLDPVADRIIVIGNDKYFHLEINSDAQSEKFFQSVFGLRFAGLKVIKGTELDSLAFKVIVNNPEFKLKYPEAKTERLFGDKILSRSASVKFDGRIESPSGELLWSGTPVDKSFDVFRQDNLEYVQNIEYDFMKASLPEESTVSKLVVPAVVLIASAIAIVLFFAIRSK
ncbi:MAG: hypothetical protein WCP39_07335 [Chlamydiota bacterium]